MSPYCRDRNSVMGRPTPRLETADKEQLGLYLNISSRIQERWIGAEQCVYVPLPSVTAVLRKSPFPVPGTLPRRWAEGRRLTGPQGRAWSHPCCLISRGSNQRRKGWQGEVLLLRSQSSFLTLFLVLWKTLDQVFLAPARLCPWRTG